MGAQEELAALAVRLVEECGVGRPDWRREEKDRRRARDKVGGEYENDASRLTDLAGAKIEFDSLDDLYSALDWLRRDPQVRIVKFKDRFLAPQKSGYRDVQLCLRTSNGHIGEFRLHLSVMDDVSKWEHSLFEVRRDLDALAELQARELSTAEVAVRDGLLREEQRIFLRALQSVLPEGSSQ